MAAGEEVEVVGVVKVVGVLGVFWRSLEIKYSLKTTELNTTLLLAVAVC